MANLRERYNTELKAVLQEKLGMNNVMAVPKLTKVVINMGVGEAANDKKHLESAVQNMTAIAGQKPVVTKARQSVASFKIREGVERGQVLSKPGAISPHTKFEAEIYVLSKDEGGRHTPFMNNYRPQFYFRTTDVTGACELPSGVEMVMPGDNIKMNIELIAPIAMDEGLKFAIREGGRTVGAGVVSKIIE